MSGDAGVMWRRERRYAAEVPEAGPGTEHRVTFGRETLDEPTPPAPEERDTVAENRALPAGEGVLPRAAARYRSRGAPKPGRGSRPALVRSARG
ncbi:hypothetical protein J2S53_001361 [Actinopolyspora lacussalsi]|nr:hypothetical protein [Actinopolyspora lacussalsi]